MISKTISVLGSTGSIGTQTLDVARKYNMKIAAIAARSNVELLAQQVVEFKPKIVCVYDKQKAGQLRTQLKGFDVRYNIEIVSGMDGLCKTAQAPCDCVVNAVVGMVGLKPTLMAIEAKRNVALANKETLVTGGHLVNAALRKNGVKLYPVDSEHSAIFQCLQGRANNKIKKIILTASGGPFFGKTAEQLKDVTVEQALSHPNWSMGNKITIDSATLMNKGLEFIEAIQLFDVAPEQIEIVVHRESIIHSAVEYADGAVIAQLGSPDMKIPIQYALTYPERVPCDSKPLSLTDCGKLTFYKPDIETFRCLKACIEAYKRKNGATTVVNGANEQAVALFLQGKIKFLEIGELVWSALENLEFPLPHTVEEVYEIDKKAREYVLKKCQL